MSMNKQDYRLIASALKSARPEIAPETSLEEWSQWEEDICAITNILQNKYPRFDRTLFLTTTGFYAGKQA